MKDKIIEILRPQVSIRSTKSCVQIAEEIDALYIAKSKEEADEEIRWLESKISSCNNLKGMEKEKWAFQQCLKRARLAAFGKEGEG